MHLSFSLERAVGEKCEKGPDAAEAPEPFSRETVVPG